jgi:hypothetical protein
VILTQLVQRYEKGVKFLDSIVTCDETWAHYYTPESKRQVCSGKTPILHLQEKPKTTFLPGMIMASVFWD